MDTIYNIYIYNGGGVTGMMVTLWLGLLGLLGWVTVTLSGDNLVIVTLWYGCLVTVTLC